MTPLQFITHEHYGCAKSGEVITLAKEDKAAVDKLKEYAIAEMTAKGIPIDLPAPK